MSAGTVPAQHVPQFTPTERRTTSRGLLRSEWIKFWSVRSIVVTMAVSFLVIVAAGQTVVMVTHDPIAAAYAHRVVLLADGRVAGEIDKPDQGSVTDALRDLAARA